MKDHPKMKELIHQYQLLHESHKGYGTTGENQLLLFGVFINLLRPKSVLDYGSGKSKLVEKISYVVKPKTYRYDPAIPELSVLPVDNVDLVLCTDVLEHIPEEFVDEFIDDLYRLSENALLSISTRMSGNSLPDGRPCHLTVRPCSWWIKKLKTHYHIVDLILEDRRSKKIIVRTF